MASFQGLCRPWLTHLDFLQRFGGDIVEQDNQTILYPKIVATVFCIFTYEDNQQLLAKRGLYPSRPRHRPPRSTDSPTPGPSKIPQTEVNHNGTPVPTTIHYVRSDSEVSSSSSSSDHSEEDTASCLSIPFDLLQVLGIENHQVQSFGKDDVAELASKVHNVSGNPFSVVPIHLTPEVAFNAAVS